MDRSPSTRYSSLVPRDDSLRDLYKQLLQQGDSVPQDLARGFSAPFLIATPSNWETSRSRTIVVGQETFGWGVSDPGAGTGRIKTFADFIAVGSEGIDALQEQFHRFDFGKKRSTPFWNAYQKLERDLENERGTIAWTNLALMDYEEGSPLAPPQVLDALLGAQAGILQGEIRALEPRAVVFFTGPNYDSLICHEFPNAQFAPVSTNPMEGFAQVQHKDLPELSFRLYHPKALRLRGQWHLLDELAQKISAGTSSTPRQ